MPIQILVANSVADSKTKVGISNRQLVAGCRFEKNHKKPKSESALVTPILPNPKPTLPNHNLPFPIVLFANLDPSCRFKKISSNRQPATSCRLPIRKLNLEMATGNWLPVANSKFSTENLSPNRQPRSYPTLVLPIPVLPYPDPTLPRPYPTPTLPRTYHNPTLVLPYHDTTRPYTTPVIPYPTPHSPNQNPSVLLPYYCLFKYLIPNRQLATNCRFKNASSCRQPLS